MPTAQGAVLAGRAAAVGRRNGCCYSHQWAQSFAKHVHLSFQCVHSILGYDASPDALDLGFRALCSVEAQAQHGIQMAHLHE